MPSNRPPAPAVTAGAAVTAKNYAIVMGVGAALTLVHFALGLAVAYGLNQLHRKLFPLPSTQAELDRDRGWYAGHVALFVFLIGLTYVGLNLGLHHLYRDVLLRRHYQTNPSAEITMKLFIAIGVILGFSWGSSVTALKTAYLIDDYRLNPAAK
jgi:hypothetical protein